MILLLTSFTATSNQKQITSDDVQVLNLVLRDLVLKGIIDNWSVEPTGHYAVLSDHAVEPMFPQSADQSIQEAEASSRVSQRETINPSEFLFGNPDGASAWILPQGRVIPKEVIVNLRKRAKSLSTLPTVSPGSALRLEVEKTSVIETTFRPSNAPSTFGHRHPRAVGLIEITLPGYSNDGTIAGLYFSRLRVGLGGGGFFVLLHRFYNDWQIEWIETVWIE